MNKNTKILFFDIDGTLISDDGKRYFPESARMAIKLARENGHLTFINTGRVFVNVDSFIRSAGFDGYVCGCGTSVIYKSQLLLHKEVPLFRCREIASKCKELGLYALFEYIDAVCVDGENQENPELKKMLSYFASKKRRIVTDINSKDFLFDKFCCYIEDASVIPEFKKFIEPDFEYIDRGPNFCEIVPKGYSKATGIQFILDYLGIPLENAYVFGDGNNDEAMFSYVPNSVIMENGPQPLKEKVMMVTGTVENDGIYNAMKKLEII